MASRIPLIGAVCSMAISCISQAQTQFPIWPRGEAPGATTSTAQPTTVERSTQPGILDRAASGTRTPELTVYPAESPNGIAILVTPGGAYQRVVLDKEGSDLAPIFNARGYTLFVLSYRLPGDGHQEGPDTPLADAERAIRTIRHQAKQWHIDPQRVGIMGFSAGGHVAASLGTRFNEQAYPPLDEIDSLSSRPDFMILMYPVISMQQEIAHANSRLQLLGEHPSAQQIQRYSLENRVTATTPPTMLIHALDDPSVKVENSLVLLDSLRAQQIPTEAHFYQQGKHGFGIRGAVGLPASSWPTLVDNWITALPLGEINK